MRVTDARAAELSDYEVLSVLAEMDRRQQAAAVKASKSGQNGSKNTTRRQQNQQQEKESSGVEADVEEQMLSSLPSNLRTIQYSVLETLRNVQRPCAHQDATQIPQFLDALHAWERGKPAAGLNVNFEKDGKQEALSLNRKPIEREKRLTKGERLMLVNHAPRADVELHLLIEDIEDRFTPEERQDLLSIVASHLPLDQGAIQADAASRTAEDLGKGNAGRAKGQSGQKSDGVDGHAASETLNAEEDSQKDVVDDGLVDADEDMNLLEDEARGGLAVEDEQGED